MKKMIIALICGAMALSFAACGSKSYTASEYSDSEVNDKVQMYIPQKTVTDETDEFTVVLEHTTDQDYNYDAGQRLEVWKNSKWCVVEDKINFTTMQLLTLPAGGSDELTFNVADHYGTLSEGRYRVVQVLSDREGNTTIAAAEFGIGRVNTK